ncbi:MAG TPA: START domain-containing protein [Smithella sp.]|nr:START domain-containing protein [Smithella sp.]
MTKPLAAMLLLLLFFNSPICLAQDKYQWKYSSTENNCQIYTSSVPGKDYIAAKATCVIPARIETIGVILRDIANYPKWMEDCAETKILQIVDDEKDEFIFWFHQHIPLMTDRDMILKSRVVFNLKNGRDTIFVDSTDEMNYVAGKEYVRMPSFSAIWTLDWVDREHTRVTFMIDPDLGQGIPKFFANQLIRTNPYKSIKRMMKMVKDNKYIQEARTSKYNRLVEEAIRVGNLR